MITRSRLQLLLRNKDVKTLTENFAYLSVLQIAGYIFPLLTVPYLARVIGVNKFGEIAFAGAVTSYFLTIVDYGFSFTATRDVAKNRDNINNISEIFSSIMWAKISLMLFSFLILIALILIVPKFYSMRMLLLISFCLIPGNILFPQWLFQGLERMKYITILNVLAKIIFTSAVFIFIKEKTDFILQPLFISLGYFISGLVAIYIILVKYRIRLHKPDLLSIKSAIKGSTDVFINQLVPNLYNNFSILLLGFWGGTLANGILDAGSRLVGISQQMMQVISRTFFPYLSRNINQHSLYAKGNILLSICITLTLFFGASPLIHLFFTSEFYSAIPILRILSFSPIFLALDDIFGTNYMIILGHTKILRDITLLCSILGFCMAWPLIFYFNFTGAAVTIVITRCLLGMTVSWKATQLKNHNILFNNGNEISKLYNT